MDVTRTAIIHGTTVKIPTDSPPTRSRIPKDNRPDHIVIHTAAAARETPDGKGQTPVYQAFEIIRNYHLSKDWLDIGYHYFVEGDGDIFQGREESMRGAHCTDMDMNHRSLGICFAGHGDLEDFKGDQYARGIPFIAQICIDLDIDPKDVIGHRETGAPKSCPGFKVNMDTFRQKVTDMIEIIHERRRTDERNKIQNAVEAAGIPPFTFPGTNAPQDLYPLPPTILGQSSEDGIFRHRVVLGRQEGIRAVVYVSWDPSSRATAGNIEMNAQGHARGDFFMGPGLLSIEASPMAPATKDASL